MKTILFAALLLTGCTTTVLKKVDVLVPTPCIKMMPAKPILPTVPQSGIYDQVKTMIARDIMHEDYETELEAVLIGCTK